mmetsp:Transcript_12482/g.37498  ORF Transcript_12482/g.37498 Transcript_12482/m.37498 type:complete len:359 (+) Transcript_12482:1372-2448(+)
MWPHDPRPNTTGRPSASVQRATSSPTSRAPLACGSISFCTRRPSLLLRPSASVSSSEPGRLSDDRKKALRSPRVPVACGVNWPEDDSGVDHCGDIRLPSLRLSRPGNTRPLLLPVAPPNNPPRSAARSAPTMPPAVTREAAMRMTTPRLRFKPPAPSSPNRRDVQERDLPRQSAKLHRPATAEAVAEKAPRRSAAAGPPAGVLKPLTSSTSDNFFSIVPSAIVFVVTMLASSRRADMGTPILAAVASNTPFLSTACIACRGVNQSTGVMTHCKTMSTSSITGLPSKLLRFDGFGTTEKDVTFCVRMVVFCTMKVSLNARMVAVCLSTMKGIRSGPESRILKLARWSKNTGSALQKFDG